MRLLRPILDLTEEEKARFWLHVDKRSEDECWPWLKCVNNKGYGRAAFGHKGSGHTYLSHRVAYFLATGRQPGQLCVCHTCDTPPCCNPTHLFLGTHKDNMQDMFYKNRRPAARGEAIGIAILTEDDVRAIRAANRRGVSGCQIARMFGVSESTVSQIVNRKTWAHVA